MNEIKRYNLFRDIKSVYSTLDDGSPVDSYIRARKDIVEKANERQQAMQNEKELREKEQEIANNIIDMITDNLPKSINCKIKF